MKWGHKYDLRNKNKYWKTWQKCKQNKLLIWEINSWVKYKNIGDSTNIIKLQTNFKLYLLENPFYNLDEFKRYNKKSS